jgi:ATP-binding cassette subfamily B (MDR/TAP) protein 1
VGRLTTRLAADTALVKQNTGDRLGVLLQASSSLITGVIVAFTASWRLALVMLAMLPLLMIAGRLQFVTRASSAPAVIKAFEDGGHIATESVAAMRTVAAFNMQRRLQESFCRTLDLPMQVWV